MSKNNKIVTFVNNFFKYIKVYSKHIDKAFDMSLSYKIKVKR